ncbi:MAG TPA: MBOAT family O-acyltransferase [Bacteroidia bacterium]|nr:MBOAT family O-acyltransferase [Bacteroidia bacterium]
MGFNSLHFVFFLPIVFTLHWILPHKWRWLFLLFASYYFYMSWDPWFGILLLGTTVIDWWAALQIEKATAQAKKKAFLLLSLFSNLGCLAAFKYSAFFYNTFEWTTSKISGDEPHFIQAILIPVGLSFYVFHSLSYTIDVYRGKIAAEKHLGIFALFVSFFPQLVAGPIARFGDLGVQFHSQKFLKSEMLITGARLALWGYFKKIAIADRLADYVNPFFEHPDKYDGLTLLLAGFFFVVQVYCDFSGYSDIATGIARMFGYELKLNWRRPLLSKSLQEFWSRNHISMTSWFRDYLYVSLGGSRVSYPRWLLNLFLVFLISGLWHGASWTFVVWGAMHGIVYILEILLKGKIRIRFLGWPYLILFHTISLIAFRANSFHDLKIFYGKIFRFDWSLSRTYMEMRTLHDLLPLLLALCGIIFLFLKELSEEHAWFTKLPKFENIWRPVFYTLLFVALFAIGQFSANEFIYFQF